MKEDPELIGRRYSDEEKEDVKVVLENWAKEAESPVEGELEKTEEQIKMIEAANDLISDRLRKLGFENYESFPKEKVHFVSEDFFKKNTSSMQTVGHYRAVNDNIYISADTKGMDLLDTLIHEGIHRASKQKFSVNQDYKISSARLGYQLTSDWKKAEKQIRLSGFNEIMVTYSTMQILKENPQKLAEFGLDEKDMEKMNVAYFQYAGLFFTIARTIADKKDIKTEEALLDLERGQFQNSILALKDVERACGKDSLEMLSYLGAPVKEQNKLDQMVTAFFLEKDTGAKEELKKKIREFYGSNLKPAGNH